MKKGKFLITIGLILILLGIGVLIYFEFIKEEVTSIVGTYEREAYVCTEETPGYNETLDISYIKFNEDKTFEFADNNCFAADEFHGTYKLLDNNQIEFTFDSDSSSFEDIEYVLKDDKITANNVVFTKK